MFAKLNLKRDVKMTDFDKEKNVNLFALVSSFL